MAGWLRVRCGGTLPPAVDRLAAATVGHQVFVFGGCDGFKRLNSIFTLDTGKYSQQLDFRIADP